MAKANRNAYKGGISPRAREIPESCGDIDWQVLDNSSLNVINRVGIQRNKHVGCSGSTNTGHSPKVSDK